MILSNQETATTIDEGVDSPGHSDKDIFPSCFDEVTLPALFAKVSCRDWITDSGAASHVTGDKNAFTNLMPPPPNVRIMGVGGVASVMGQGTVAIPISVDGKHKTFTIDNVLYAPGLPFNIISVKKLCQQPNGTRSDIEVLYTGDTCEISRRSTTDLIAKAMCIGPSLYKLCLQEETREQHSDIATTLLQETSMYTWHRRLGHLKESRLRRILKDSLGIVFPRSEQLPRCEPCFRATLTRHNNRTPGKRATRPLERVFLDVGGPVKSRQGNKIVQRFWLVVVDDYSRYRWVKMLQFKSNVNSEFITWKKWAENQFDLKVQKVRNDNGGEFTNHMLTELHEAAGVEMELTAPHNPEQNGVAERTMGILLNHVRAILIDSGLPDHCFGEVLKSVCKLVNFHPTSSNNDQAPHLRLYKEPLPLLDLRPIGCECWKPVPKVPGLTKFHDRAEKCYLLGYANGTNQYRVWNSIKKRVEIVRDLRWVEDQFFPENTRMPETVYEAGTLDDMIQQEQVNASRLALVGGDSDSTATLSASQTSLALATNIPVLMSSDGTFNEQFRLKDHGIDSIDIQNQISGLKQQENGADGGDQKHSIETLITSLICAMEQHQGKEWLTIPAEVVKGLDLLEPKTYQQAMRGPASSKWDAAVVEETNSLNENRTWTITNRPKDKRVLSGKYVFKIKTDSTGNPERYKARWVVRGFEQEYGVDFQETYASVVKPMSYRVLFALACALGWEIEQMDVKTAFLYGDIDTEVYVELPPNLQDEHSSDKVCRLHKALYGLKQAPKIWFDTLCKELRDLGFENINEDYSIFIQKSTGVIMGVYVDDLLLMGKDKAAINQVKRELNRRFKMTDLGPASYYLGINISRAWTKYGNKLFLSQTAYVDKILKDFNLDSATPMSTPMDDKLVLSPADDGQRAKDELRQWYQSAVGSLMYLMLCTRPDIAFAISQLSRFSANPTERHRTAVKRVFRYLKATRDYGLVFDSARTECGLIGYTDANWARDNDRRSTGGYLFMLFGTIITWSSKRQATVALSSCEAEYMAETEAAKEAIWLRRLLNNFEYGHKGSRAVKILGDNRGALALAKNPEFHSRTKHIDIRYHFVRQKVQEGLIDLEWTGTATNLADGMTKPLGGNGFQEFRKGIGMKLIG